jgi:amidase
MKSLRISAAQSNNFVVIFEGPPTDLGPLDRLCFAVKDLNDKAGWKTGCRNPTRRDSHPPAVVDALCVEQLLRAGARFMGKTISD